MHPKKIQIQLLREENAWSIAELARRAGVAAQTVAKMERGDSTSRLSRVKVSKALGKNIDEITW